MGTISQKRNLWSVSGAPKNVNLTIMKTKKEKTVKAKLPAGFTVDPSLNGKYDDQPLFKEKMARANHILKTVGVPKLASQDKPVLSTK